MNSTAYRRSLAVTGALTLAAAVLLFVILWTGAPLSPVRFLGV